MNAVHLKDVRFHAFHGVYEQEAVTGGDYEVNLSVWYPSGHVITRLEDTINYVRLYAILLDAMQQRYSLLESLAADVCHTIRQEFPVIKEIRMEVYKLRPPITHFEGKTGITYQQSY
ncbi:MAG TPA: dihydroneopterin aldolase [Lacibacter sp.]|nr:dihydroneopterin aldolase [Lacibacter sp.]HMO89824.1 dihydroneopterin aldolase [Lacibacter sp.]HMP86516.1 dihydroneopterin aldolase [Lacibacter sp.]